MTGRQRFFRDVYENAKGEAEAVPWADERAKPQLLDWLNDHPGQGRRAIDVACGLGDNAEALSDHGWDVTAFDYSSRAIDWARERFPQSTVDYQVVDLFDLPEAWHGAFDLVHECYTLQALTPDTLDRTVQAIASLVAPGGRLIVYTRIRPVGAVVDGPPWPLEIDRTDDFEDHGLVRRKRLRFDVIKGARHIPHIFDVWRKEG